MHPVLKSIFSHLLRFFHWLRKTIWKYIKKFFKKYFLEKDLFVVIILAVIFQETQFERLAIGVAVSLVVLLGLRRMFKTKKKIF